MKTPLAMTTALLLLTVGSHADSLFLNGWTVTGKTRDGVLIERGAYKSVKKVAGQSAGSTTGAWGKEVALLKGYDLETKGNAIASVEVTKESLKTTVTHDGKDISVDVYKVVKAPK